ncbi:MAG: lysoplasmalogenase [Bacteroidota bacterium]
MSTPILLFAIAVSSLLQILADARKQFPLTYIFKPLVLVLIIVLATQTPIMGNPRRWAIIAGLLFSLAGDIFLMLRERRFLAGLVSFLAAHLCYCVAFFHPPDVSLSITALPIFAAGAVFYRLLAPGLHRLKIPVLVYLVFVLAMVTLAIHQWILHPSVHTGVTALGASLFVVSDALLALREFRKAFPWSQKAILLTYFAAQTCIAWG